MTQPDDDVNVIDSLSMIKIINNATEGMSPLNSIPALFAVLGKCLMQIPEPLRSILLESGFEVIGNAIKLEDKNKH